MIAQAEYCPSMIGGVPLLVRSCVLEIPLETLEPGDVICHNDPYRGGLHCPEHTLIKPVFVDDELMGFAMTIGHLQEIGGMVPGAFAGEATEIFHEGIRVPPVKIKSRGEDVEEVWKLLLANVRTPRYNYGDLRALIAGVDVGERGLAKLIRKYGKEQFRRNVLDLMDYSESRMRAEIGAIEDGVYRFQDQVEDDGIESKPYDIKVAVHIQGDEVVIDYSGTSPQALGPINATLGVRTRPPTTASCRSPTRPSRRTRAASARSAWSRRPAPCSTSTIRGPRSAATPRPTARSRAP